jgi:hypothetical protein
MNRAGVMALLLERKEIPGKASKMKSITGSTVWCPCASLSVAFNANGSKPNQ